MIGKVFFHHTSLLQEDNIRFLYQASRVIVYIAAGIIIIAAALAGLLILLQT